MTSGNFSSVPVDSIWLDREKRQRRTLDPKRVQELADSITRSGLIHPPVITQAGELIAGERRLAAIRLLGWTHLPVQYAEDLSEEELHLIELEENVRRVDLTWQEECLAVERYHQMRQALEPEWTGERTAEALGIDAPAVASKRAVAKEILGGNERIAKAERYSVARNIVRRSAERKRTSTLAAIDAEFEAPPVREAPLLNVSFHDWQPDYSGPKFNFIHCDFPYGISANKQQQGNNVALYGGYDDGEDVYWQLLDRLALAMDNVVAESAHLIFWFSMDFYTPTLEQLTNMGWRVNPFPLVWLKSDNTGLLPDPERGPRRIYETAFFASCGDRKVVSAVSNAFAHPGKDKSIHMSEKPQAMLRHFLRMVVDEYSIVLDPTAGSGNVLKVATSLGAPTVLGLEQSEEFYTAAKEAYFDDD